MTLTPYVVESFTGINVLADPFEVGQSISTALLNVDINRLGQVRTRDGYSLVTGTAATVSPGAMSYYKTSAAVEYVVAVTDTASAGVTTPYALATGTAGTTVSDAPASNNGFTRFGTDTASSLYVSGSQLRKYDGTSWSTVSTALSTTHFAIAVTPSDNRLVLGTGDFVYFSDAGAPDTFTSGNFVGLHPGDGEKIKANVAWRELLFVFKENKFFVFTGTSEDGDGLPIFNYRAVTAGHGCTSHGAAVAGDEGVYFANSTGIYVTSGDAPRYISRAIEPWLRGGSFPSLSTFSLRSPDAVGRPGLTLTYFDRRLYVTDTANQTTLVYDAVLDAWLIWDLNVTGMCAVPTNGQATTGVHFGESGTKKLAAYGTSTSDSGSAIAWSWTSGKYHLTDTGQVVATHETNMEGTGTVDLTLTTDYGTSLNSATLGTSPNVAVGWPEQMDTDGRWMQHTVSGSGPGMVARLTHFISNVWHAGY